MAVTFEKMIVEHLDQVLQIEKVSFPTPWSRDSFMGEILQNDFALYIVAMDDGAVIGYGGMWLILDEAHITNVAVRPDLRGKNIGKALMLEIIRQAVLRGAHSMTLEVRPANKTARRLYHVLGFKERGVRKRYYAETNEDAIIMWKDNLPAQGFKPFHAGRYNPKQPGL
ncbi:MAG: ribosomal protein S18-alanine N-acetyltransferase [Desulfotomaculaceae bacterium]|nr:ribosomal protein S18-alanine N-acetyltransferase [Desulfotomaculaceae bacterium]